jgi:protein-tyrosine phosphatase
VSMPGPSPTESDEVVAPYRFLIVCSGNICRSPMAEAFIRHQADVRGWRIETRSGGTLNIRGRPADPLAIRVMGEREIDLKGHISRGVEADDVAWADWILVMEIGHRQQLRDRFPDCESKLLLLGTFGGFVEVPDPIGGWRWRFRKSRDQIERCTIAFLDQLPPRPI